VTKRLLIKSYVKLILESAPSAEDAEAAGLGLYIAPKSSQKVYMLYDVAKLRELLEVDASPKKFSSCVYGVMFIKLRSQQVAREWGAKQVERSAAQQGYGPLLYDIAMELEGGLTPDRMSVSPAAEHVWDFYKDNRSDVEAKLLDDMNNPKTPTKQDDTGFLHDGGEESSLNYAYFIEGGTDAQTLIANHRGLARSVKNKFTSNDFDLMAINFFSKMYKH